MRTLAFILGTVLLQSSPALAQTAGSSGGSSSAAGSVAGTAGTSTGASGYSIGSNGSLTGSSMGTSAALSANRVSIPGVSGTRMPNATNPFDPFGTGAGDD